MILRTAPEGIGTQREILLEASSTLAGKTLEPSALEEALDGGPWRLHIRADEGPILGLSLFICTMETLK